MNLHGLVTGRVGAVNPSQRVTIRTAQGTTTLPDGKRVPAYGAPEVVIAQVQGMNQAALHQTQGLNLGTDACVAYLPGNWSGVIRASQKGGDLITLSNGTNWLVVAVLESYPDWCKVALTRQNP